MAALRELPIAIRRVGLLRFIRKIWFEVTDDNLFTWASALAYSWLFAIFPFLLVLLALIPTLPSRWRLETKQQIDFAVAQLPREAQITIKEYVDPKLNSLLFDKPVALKGIWSFGLVITLFAASGGVAMTMSAMDRAYDVQRARPFYKQRPLAVMLTIAMAGLILAVVVLIPVGTLVTRYLTRGTERLLVQTGMTHAPTRQQTPAEVSATAPTTATSTQPVAREMLHSPGRFGFALVVWQITRFGLAGMFLFWVVALMYYFGPNVKQKFRIFTPGSVFTVGTWTILGATFRIYVDTFGKYGQTYGAVGGVVILLFFFYVDALVLLIGAEINAEIDATMRAIAHEQIKPPPQAETEGTHPAVETP